MSISFFSQVVCCRLAYSSFGADDYMQLIKYRKCTLLSDIKHELDIKRKKIHIQSCYKTDPHIKFTEFRSFTYEGLDSFICDWSNDMLLLGSFVWLSHFIRQNWVASVRWYSVWKDTLSGQVRRPINCVDCWLDLLRIFFTLDIFNGLRSVRLFISYLFEIAMFSNVLNVTFKNGTFVKFHVSLLKKSINFLKNVLCIIYAIC